MHKKAPNCTSKFELFDEYKAWRPSNNAQMNYDKQEIAVK